MKTDEFNKYEKLMAELKDNEQVNQYIEEFCEDNKKAFSEILNQTITQNDLKVADVMRSSGINANYGYNIVNGTRTKPGRDKIIALCIGSGMSFEETQEALDVSGLARLYYKSERDVRIAAAINNMICDVVKVNMDLSDHGLDPLAV